MKTDLISDLAKDLRPVRRLPSPPALTATLALGGAAVVALTLLTLHFRTNAPEKIAELVFALNLFALVATSIVSLTGAAILAVPARRLPGWWRRLFAAVVLILAGSLFLTLTLATPMFELGLRTAGGLPCTVTTSLLTFANAALGGWILRRGASTSPGFSAGLVALSALSMGWIGIALHCSDDSGVHLAVWHFLLPGLVAFCATRVLRRHVLRW